jgi:hypothetical protein
LVKTDAKPVMAIIVGAIEAIGIEKYMLKPTPIRARMEIMNAKICPRPLYFTEAFTSSLLHFVPKPYI